MFSRSDRVLIPILILVVSVVGCRIFSGPGGSTETVYAPTEVGTPQGDKIAKEIGPAGGTLSSPDGRMTLTVPQGALTETITFSMQPITNKAVNGLGVAYRLEPNGMTFPKPLQLSLKYDEKDMEGTVPEAFAVAYQDEKGAWHAQKTAKLDQNTKTIRVSTAHFTDWSFLSRVRLDPKSTKLRPGETQVIQLVICKDQGFLRRVFSRQEECVSQGASSERWSLMGPGTLDVTFEGGQALYIAPPQRPSPNVATVMMSTTLEQWAEDRLETMTVTFESTITILGGSFKASGQNGPVTYSGTICSLDEPFEVTGNHPIFTYPFKFTPISQTTGTMTYGTANSGITASGSGTYDIVGRDTESPHIVMDTKSTARIPVKTTSGGGKATITLTPIGPGEGCE